MVTCTSPPPACPCTSASASSSCASISCCCTCCACASERRHVGLMPPGSACSRKSSGQALSGLHDSLLASWSRLGFAWRIRRSATSSLVARRATVTPVPCPYACVSAPRPAVGLLVAASTLSHGAATPRPSNIAGMIVFLDPGHNGANDASLTKQVPTGRGGTKDCQTSGTTHRRRLPRAHLQLGHRAADPPGADRSSACAPRCPAATTPGRGRASTSARRWPTRCSPTPSSPSTPTADRPPAAASTCCTRQPPLNQAQAGPSVQFARDHARPAAGIGHPAVHLHRHRAASTRAPTSPG